MHILTTYQTKPDPAQQMNRFFYSCPHCLFKSAIEAPGHRAPECGPCPVCTHAMHTLGATRGVLRWETPCNDKCTMATGKDCSCSCGGKNHGSQIVVPVIGKVMDLSAYPQAPLAQLRAACQKWLRIRTEIQTELKPEIKAALIARKHGERIGTDPWNQMNNYNRAQRHADSLQLYRLRFKALEEVRAKYCTTDNSAIITTSTAPVQPFRATQLALF